MPPAENIKKVLRIVWACILISGLSFYLFFGHHLTATGIAQWVKEHNSYLLAFYCFICAARGLTLLPSTPFIFAGIILFPDSPGWLLAISLGCILLSSAIIYYASEYLGFGEYFENKHPKSTARMRKRLSKQGGFFFIAGWALFPFTPTDLMLYIAGSIKLPFPRIIIPLMIGEAIICSIYIFNGVKLIEYLL